MRGEVCIGERRFDLAPGGVLTIGRQEQSEFGVVGLDATDLGISRRAIEIACGTDGLLVVNVSSKVPVFIDRRSPGRLVALPPGSRFLIGEPVAVEIRGLIRRHRIDVTPESVPPRPATGQRLPGTVTQVRQVDFTSGELDALTALFHGYLRDFPRRSCQPTSYAEAGKLLGLPPSTVRRRVEHVRERLRSVEVYLEGSSAKEELAAYVLEHGIITEADLGRLRHAQSLGAAPSGK